MKLSAEDLADLKKRCQKALASGAHLALAESHLLTLIEEVEMHRKNECCEEAPKKEKPKSALKSLPKEEPAAPPAPEAPTTPEAPKAEPPGASEEKKEDEKKPEEKKGKKSEEKKDEKKS